MERERCQVNASNGIMGGLFVGKEAVLFCRAQAPPALPCPAQSSVLWSATALLMESQGRWGLSSTMSWHFCYGGKTLMWRNTCVCECVCVCVALFWSIAHIVCLNAWMETLISLVFTSMSLLLLSMFMLSSRALVTDLQLWFCKLLSYHDPLCISEFPCHCLTTTVCCI